ncbi:MAG: hypothetical protein AAF927_02365 [Bacteroidota bacterium]
MTEIDLGAKAEQQSARQESIRSQLRNQRIDEQMNDYLKAGIVDEVAYVERDQNDEHSLKSGDAVFKLKMQYRDQGFDFQTAPVWDETGEIIGYRCFTINPELSQEQAQRKEEIEFVAEKRFQNSWQYEIEEQELYFQKEVEHGSMVYLGQLNDDDYFSMRNDLNIPFGNIETLPVFDEKGNANSTQQKVYVYTGGVSSEI